MSFTKIACIGNRNIPEEYKPILKNIGSYLIKKGFIIASGNATGSDEWFCKGGNEINPTNINLYLPNKEYNIHLIHPDNNIINIKEDFLSLTEIDSVLEKVHPKWNELRENIKNIHRRNYSIIKNSKYVVCYMDETSEFGGTILGAKIAKTLDIPVINIKDIKNPLELIEKRII